MSLGSNSDLSDSRTPIYLQKLFFNETIWIQIPWKMSFNYVYLRVCIPACILKLPFLFTQSEFYSEVWNSSLKQHLQSNINVCIINTYTWLLALPHFASKKLHRQLKFVSLYCSRVYRKVLEMVLLLVYETFIFRTSILRLNWEVD